MKNKELKVYIQYPWKTSDSQYYKSLIEQPPEGIKYISESKKVGMLLNKNLFNIRTFFKAWLRDFLRISRISVINAHKIKTNLDYDLIHCAHCLNKDNNKPWVADFEGAWQMWVMGNASKRTKEKIKEILLNENCKKILAWTETSKKEIISTFPEIRDKVEIVSYAMKFPRFKKRKGTKKINLVFVSRYFYAKGGLHALEAFDILTKKYSNVEATFISDIPKNIFEKYSKNKKIKIFGLLPYEKIIKEIYPSSDIVIYPGYSDSFGFAFIESLAFGLPVVTVDGFARKDIIENGKTGYVIEKPKEFVFKHNRVIEKEIIEKLVEKASKLIENKNLRKKMSKECIKTVRTGKFSIKERNNRLRRIYEEAIK
jgi:glycosyltransferase involved in cell wall biosynthesis